MVFLLKRLPTRLCVALTSPIAFVFFLCARPQGHAVHANLHALFPAWNRLRCWLGAYQVFRQFALTYLDRLLYRHCGREVDWDVRGMEHFEQLKTEPTGVLVFTMHSGNYDIGSALLAEQLGRCLHTVRVPERSQSLEQLRAAELLAASDRQPLLRFHYNTPGGHLGIDLCRLLLAGEIVAVQGDRVVSGVSPLTALHDGVSYTIPLGPLMLAETARVPCYSIFSSRFGVCRYRIEIVKPFSTGTTRLTRSELAALWLPVMADFLQRNWDQWFVFEKVLERFAPSAPDNHAAIWRVIHPPVIPYVLLPQMFSLRTPQHAQITVGDNDLTMRSRFSLLVEPVARGPESMYLGISAGPSLEYWLAGHQTCWYAGAGGGCGLIDSTNVPGGQGQDFTLNWYATGGLRYYPKTNLALNAGVFFQHLSNGGATDPNPGLNCLGPLLGLSWHF